MIVGGLRKRGGNLDRRGFLLFACLVFSFEGGLEVGGLCYTRYLDLMCVGGCVIYYNIVNNNVRGEMLPEPTPHLGLQDYIQHSGTLLLFLRWLICRHSVSFLRFQRRMYEAEEGRN